MDMDRVDLADEGEHVLLAGLLERDAEQALRVPPRLKPLCLRELPRARDGEHATLGAVLAAALVLQSQGALRVGAVAHGEAERGHSGRAVVGEVGPRHLVRVRVRLSGQGRGQG